MRDLFREPMATRLDKLIFMQSRTLFLPSITLSHELYLVDQLLPCKIGLPFPLDHVRTMPDIDGTGTAIQS